MEKRILFQSCLILFILLFICVAATHAQWQTELKGPQIDYTVFSEYETAIPDTSIKLVIQFKLEPEWHINSNKPLDEFLIPTELNIETSPYIQVKKIIYPSSKQVRLSFSEEPISVFENEFYIGIEVLLLPDAKTQNAIELTGSLRYQACNDRQCLPPTNLPIKAAIKIGNSPVPANEDILTRIKSIPWEQASSVSEKNDAEIEKQTATPIQQGTTSTPTQENWEEQIRDFQIVGRLDGYASKNEFIKFIETAEQANIAVQSKANRTIISLLLIILIGGLALNLTPCVLPVIPLNLAIIGAGVRAGSRIRGFLLGLAYGLGISLVYGGLGVAVVLGFSKTFGAINSTYWFNGLITLLFIILALAMFDLIVIDFSRFQTYIGVRKNPRGSFWIALFMGGVSALLAGACVAPVVISTILQAQDLYSQGYKSALLLPFLLGVGMALPWPILGAGMSLLPKPGKWMEYVKYAFGVFLLCLAGYYGYTTYTLFNTGNIKTEQLIEGWHTSIEDGLNEAKTKNQPVIIDFWATWCKNCLVMNKTVLSDETVKEKLKNFAKIKYQAENPDSPETKKVLEHFEVLGLPTFVILKPKENK